MIETNRMRLGQFEFAINSASFRRITECWSGPGWDFIFRGTCVNDVPDEPIFGLGIAVYCDAAPLPLAKAADYTGREIVLRGFYDEEGGEPYFAVDVGESFELSDVRMLFAERNGNRYRIELSGTISASVTGRLERLELSAWTDELADHAHGMK